jgi:group II intron reverse transcriptase/maturase
MKRSNEGSKRSGRGHGDPYTGTKAETPETAKGEPTAEGSGADEEPEIVEGRGLVSGNTERRDTPRTQRREGVPGALERVRQAAKRDGKAKFTALFHHVTVDRLRQAFSGLNPRASAGTDGVTWEQYGSRLEENLVDLHSRLHRGAYRARPSRRVYIPKSDGRERPLGVASLEDKLVQRVVVEVLNPIYETDFLGFSYGFRPGRGAHDALDALATAIDRKKVNWVLDADIRGFFDAIDHEWLMKLVEHRVADRRVLRLIRKWLNAGVMENGEWAEASEGTPQGATISPLLANIYLHYVFDLWVQRWRSQPGRGEVVVVRYADDFIVGFENRTDAERFLAELRERLAKFRLELHPEKTRLIQFGRFARTNRAERGLGKPETFDFLGFTHISGKTREGKFLLRRQTIRSRMRRKLADLKGELKRRRHQPIPEQGKWLGQVVGGYFNYFAVPTNTEVLSAFRCEVQRHWLRALRRRSQKDRTPWSKIKSLSRRWLPLVRVRHPYPWKRFDVRRGSQRASTRDGSRVR